ncbi:MAG: [FeFe] hydrogenase H-cluster radical SAM maturase HydG, partial [Patescibacteria group bacterium]
VGEDELLKIIAILRLAVPYTGMIISTRERPEVRAKAFEIGISQTSAGSRTSPGGYGKEEELAQFHTQDHRSTDQMVESLLRQGFLPSFCTACYRKGRTGETFMNIAKPGDIHNFCRPNAILTFKEYLEDYASETVKGLSEAIVNKYLDEITDEDVKKQTLVRMKMIAAGDRDLYF